MSKNHLLIVAAFIAPLCLQMSVARAQEYVLTVEEMFCLAEDNNKNLILSKTSELEAAQSVDVARNDRLPSIGASLSGSFLSNARIIDRDLGNSVKAPLPHFMNNFVLEAQQVVYAGGAIKQGINAARIGEQIAGASTEATRQGVRFMLMGYYLEMFSLMNQREVYAANIELTKILLRDINSRHEQGLAIKNDITRYELQLKSLELALTQVENNISIINFDLTSALGLPEEIRIIPDKSILDRTHAGGDIDYWQAAAEENLPTLDIARLRIDASRVQEKIVRSAKLPKVAIVAANNFSGPITVEIPAINKNINYWYVGVGVSYNFGSLYKNKRNARVARTATVRAQQNLDYLREQAEAGVHSSYTKLNESFVQLDTYEKSAELARENYDVINNRYNNDLALLTEMVDASNERLTAELQLVNARVNIVYNQYKLKYSAGTL